MDCNERLALQRQKVREALGVLHGVSELFDIENDGAKGDWSDLDIWNTKIAEFERWLLKDSPLA